MLTKNITQLITMSTKGVTFKKTSKKHKKKEKEKNKNI